MRARIGRETRQPSQSGYLKSPQKSATSLYFQPVPHYASGMETAASEPPVYRITIPGLLRAKGRTFTDAKTVQAERHIQHHAIEQIGKPCLTGPLHVSLTINIAPPPSWSRKKTAEALAGRILPTSRPDIDNQMKTAADALNGIAWKDDAQIVDATLSRRYGPESMTVIEVTPL